MSEKQNLIELKDGIIYYTQAGDQTQKISTNTIEAIRLLAEGLPEVKLLVDYGASGKMSKESLQSGLYAMQSLRLDKVAIIWASPYLIELVSSMARTAGKSKIIHFAESREAAIDWLKANRL
ncbi:MAG TPA: hypothetical protein VN778_00665 [Verrucomicrobiae bacterium]|nr:hypothetical protein [Verrucomicrobiae bacterium]